MTDKLDNRIILSFDQSYFQSGYAISQGGSLLHSGSICLDKHPSKIASRKFIWALARALNKTYAPDVVVCEQVRLKNSFGINLKSIKALLELSAEISTAIFPQELYTIDSRSWKAKIVGKAGATKEETIEFVKNKFGIEVNDDRADAICMSLYPFEKKAILNPYE